MRVLIFSDTHLTDKFDEKQYRYLEKIIYNSDQVIINGDFWSNYFVDFKTFVRSEWKKLFPLLKRKNAIYLYGNHDKERYCNLSMDLFSVERGHSYQLESGGKKFYVTHGKNILKGNGLEDGAYESVAKGSFLYKFKPLVDEYRTKLFGLSAYHNGKRLNKVIKQNRPKYVVPEEYLVCGHTHYPEVDLENKFVGLGFIRFGQAHYLLINDGELQLVKDKY